MTHRFDQQEPSIAFGTLKSVATPQHGQKADPKTSKIKETRSFQPRQAH